MIELAKMLCYQINLKLLAMPIFLNFFIKLSSKWP